MYNDVFETRGRLERFLDQIRSSRREYLPLGRIIIDACLYPHVVWHLVVLEQVLAKGKVRFRCGWIRDLNFLESHLHEMSEEAHFLLV